MLSTGYSRISILVPLALLILTASCDSVGQVDRLEFVTAQESYESGDTVEVRLENGTHRNVGYNMCAAFVDLELRADGDWEIVAGALGGNAARTCTSMQHNLRVGDTAQGTFTLSDAIDAGMYRLAQDVEIGGSRRTVTSNSFTVRSD